jgi:hypothetical protein
MVINNYLELESVWKAFYSWNPILLCQQPLIIQSSCIQLQLFFFKHLWHIKIHRMPHSVIISVHISHKKLNILAAILICIPAMYKKISVCHHSSELRIPVYCIPWCGHNTVAQICRIHIVKKLQANDKHIQNVFTILNVCHHLHYCFSQSYVTILKIQHFEEPNIFCKHPVWIHIRHSEVSNTNVFYVEHNDF